MEKQKPSIEQDKVSGLDMGPTLSWYQDLEIEMPPILNAELPYPIENQDLIELSEKELGSLFALFPENARKRSILRKIVGQSATWFHQDSLKERPKTTTNKMEAISPTAIVPSYIDYTPWKELKVPTADIWLYEIPSDIVSEKVRKIVLSEGFVHEVAHSIVQPALYVDGYKLKFPSDENQDGDGKIISGFNAILNFAELAEKHPPISHYASFYRGLNNKFESEDPNYNAETAISEELCETIAAYLLGFSYTKDANLSKDNPLDDRPEIKKFIEDFLNSELLENQ